VGQKHAVNKPAPRPHKLAAIQPDPQPVDAMTAPIACGNAVEQGGRVRVLCQ
jgi:hypothetical protein